MQTPDSISVAERLSGLDFAGALRESQAKVIGWVEGLITHLPNLVAAAIVFAVFLVVARVVRGGARRVLARVSHQSDINRLLATLSYVVVVFAGLFFALDVMNLDRTVTSLLAGAGIIGLALGFAFQDTAENFISGVGLAVRKEFTDGDVIETNDHMGVVQDVNLRSTIIRTFDGQLVIIPNNKVYKEVVINYTRFGVRRVNIEVGVAYGEDLRRAANVAAEAVRDVPNRIQEREINVFYTGFDDSSITFELRFWIPFAVQTDFLAARSEAVIRVKEAFDREGITIPFPIRTLDFSEVGGETLRRAWPGSNGSAVSSSGSRSVSGTRDE